MADKEKILAALAQLDPLDDDQWTADGAPKVEVVTGLAGEAVKRQDIVNAAPDFNREKAGAAPDEEGDAGDGEGEGDGDQNDAGDGNDEGGQNETGEGDQGDGSDEGAGTGDEGDQGGDEPEVTDPELNAGDEDEDEFEPPSREMSEGEFQSWLRTVPKEELENIEAALKKQHDDVGLEIQGLQELQKRITRASSMTRVRIKEAFPNSPNAHAIRTFIESQNRARAERVARRQTILKGIRPEELDFRAPIDAAYARKTKRGTQRPVRPLVK